jgi:8-oxo-dGTP pyrophosphatase MutT (NUDIX family)
MQKFPKRSMSQLPPGARLTPFDGSKIGVLSGQIDRYKGIKIADENIEGDWLVQDRFSDTLKKSLDVYRQEGFRGVWLKLTTEKVHLAGVAAQEHGFKFHHAKDGYVMLTKWLPETMNKLPGFASHYVGVGGLVLDRERQKVLAIQERKPLINDLWKLPGGLVETGESIQEAAIREVWEETGIKTKFVSILGFRELLRYQWGQQDLYFVCLLEPAEGASTAIDVQMPDEIAKADWIPLVSSSIIVNHSINIYCTCRVSSDITSSRKWHRTSAAFSPTLNTSNKARSI